MRILVTGVSGFSGSHLACALVNAGHNVTGVQRRETKFTGLAASTGVRLLTLDLAAAASLSGPFEGVVHAAATSPAPGVDVAALVHDNVEATAALIQAAKRWGTRRFVMLSSLSLHGRIECRVVDESCPVIDPDAYGATKHLCELMLAEQAGSMAGLALRLPGVVGPGARRNWLSTVAAKLSRGETIQAFHLDAPYNNAVHVEDMSKLVTLVISRGWQGFDAVVLGARGALTVRKVIERLARGLGVEARIRPVAATKPSFLLCSERAIENWGYEPMEIGAMIDRYASEVLCDRASVP